MLIAAALVLPSVALSESHTGGTLHVIAIALNWVTWSAFLIELVVMLAVVPDRRTWLHHNPLDLVLVIVSPPILPLACKACGRCASSACCASSASPRSRVRSSRSRACATGPCWPC